LLDTIRHPVIWMGKLIDLLDNRLNRTDRPPQWRKVAGVFSLALLLLATLVPTAIVGGLLRQMPAGWIIEAILATSLLAQKELGLAVRSVAARLDFSLEAGRKAVRGVVGRDPETLDAAGVSRAAIESLAGIALYKAINTADSMIGHKNPKYLDFGWASARLDDLVNWIPARLTGLLFVAAAFLVSGANPKSAWDVMFADAAKHDSPNAGWPEAAMAGALDVALGGPRTYDGEIHPLPKLGRGRDDLGPADIRKALDLYAALLNITLGLCVATAIVVLR
jgi:adenosylcobinamide-phosphate synthase